MSPDHDQTEQFLNALDPTAKCWTFQTFDDSKERREERKERGGDDPFAHVIHDPLAKCWPRLVKLNAQGAGIFITVNETDFKGRSESNIVRVRALFVDLDGAPLQPVLEGPLKPTIVVQTSPGRFHCYWRIRDCPLEQFAPLQKRIAARFGGDPKVHDLPRVMRLPGFLHQKDSPSLSRMEINSHA